MAGVDQYSHESHPTKAPAHLDPVLHIAFPTEAVNESTEEPESEAESMHFERDLSEWEETKPDQIVEIDFSTFPRSSDDSQEPQSDVADDKISVLNLDSTDSEPADLTSATEAPKEIPITPLPGTGQSGGPIFQAIEDMSLVAQENHRQFAWIREEMQRQAAVLPKIDALGKQVEHGNKLETANQKLFDVMHEELKGYKDGFLFEALQKPVIRDLLALFDDLCGQARRVAKFINDHAGKESPEAGGEWQTELRASWDNVNNTVHYLIEILNRLDVVMEEGTHEKLDMKIHKVVGVEKATSPEQNNTIARIVRPGFFWRDRLLRPTEVIIRKFTTTVKRSGQK